MFGGGGSARFDDPFRLLPIGQSVGLSQRESRAVLAQCRPSVAIDLAESRSDLPHSGSCLGGQPALPDAFPWPQDDEGRPLRFVGQFACADLALARLSGYPDEGLISIFLDTFDDEPATARIFYFSLKRDLMRRRAPAGMEEPPCYRLTFHTIPSLPRPGSQEYQDLRLDDDAEDAYYQLLLEVEEGLHPCQLRCGGHPPFSEEEGCYPADGGHAEWEFFLALRDVDELGISWPESGAVMLWLPREAARFVDGRAALTWQAVWDDEDDEDSPSDDDDEYEDEDDE